MHKFYKLLFTVLAILSISFSISAQNNFFTDAGQNRTVSTNGERIIVPQKFRTSGLDIQAMKNFLWTLPDEQNFIYSRSQAPIISLPMPDGSIARFHVWESSIQEPELAAKFPEMKTFAGQGIDDLTATIRFDYNPYFGFSAQVLSIKGTFYIDRYAPFHVLPSVHFLENLLCKYYVSEWFAQLPWQLCWFLISLPPASQEKNVL